MARFVESRKGDRSVTILGEVGGIERERERGRIEFRFLQVPLPLETPHSFRYKGYFIVVVAIVPSYQQPFTKAHIPVTSNSANERFQV